MDRVELAMDPLVREIILAAGWQPWRWMLATSRRSRYIRHCAIDIDAEKLLLGALVDSSLLVYCAMLLEPEAFANTATRELYKKIIGGIELKKYELANWLMLNEIFRTAADKAADKIWKEQHKVVTYFSFTIALRDHLIMLYELRRGIGNQVRGGVAV